MLARAYTQTFFIPECSHLNSQPIWMCVRTNAHFQFKTICYSFVLLLFSFQFYFLGHALNVCTSNCSLRSIHSFNFTRIHFGPYRTTIGNVICQIYLICYEHGKKILHKQYMLGLKHYRPFHFLMKRTIFACDVSNVADKGNDTATKKTIMTLLMLMMWMIFFSLEKK